MSKPVSAEFILETIHAFQRTAAIKGAIELDLFTAIGEGNNTGAALANRCNAAERGVRILADFLVVSRLLTKSGSTYGLTDETAKFLDRRSRHYMGSVTQFLLAPSQMDPFKDVPAAVRKGGATAGT